ncbi:MAG TPA: hypothetical protein VE664_08565 [Actinomycetes bacterium]|nr:hypothetical protein [Actinomycetes bacterium]
MVGYTVGGGLPVLGRAFGYAAQWVRSFQVVTAEGTLRDADATHEPELFWALRGGKGNVGIVASLACELLPLRRLYGGGLHYPGEHAADLLRAYAAWWRRSASWPGRTPRRYPRRPPNFTPRWHPAPPAGPWSTSTAHPATGPTAHAPGRPRSTPGCTAPRPATTRPTSSGSATPSPPRRHSTVMVTVWRAARRGG